DPLSVLPARDPRGFTAVSVLRELRLERRRAAGPQALVDHHRRRRVSLCGLSMECLVVTPLLRSPMVGEMPAGQRGFPFPPCGGRWPPPPSNLAAAARF